LDSQYHSDAAVSQDATGRPYVDP